MPLSGRGRSGPICYGRPSGEKSSGACASRRNRDGAAGKPARRRWHLEGAGPESRSVAGHHRSPARLMDDHLSLERTYEQVMKARPTLKATIKAVRQAVRDRGVSALYEIETRKRLAEMGILIVSPDMNDPLNPPPPSEHEHTIHHGPFMKLDEGLIAHYVDLHPEAEKEEIRSVVQRFMELGTEDSWCLALAERLMQSGDEPSRWLLEEAAKQFTAEWGTKVAERRR